MYLCSFGFIAACVQFAFYNAMSIKGKSNTWLWHCLQWTSVSGFVCSGCLFGAWAATSFNFHDFGSIIAIAVLGVPAYVGMLHLLLKLMDKSL